MATNRQLSMVLECMYVEISITIYNLETIVEDFFYAKYGKICMKHCLWLTYESRCIPMRLTKISITTHPPPLDHPSIWIRLQYVMICLYMGKGCLK